jgi:membrane-associated protease RseP (regulator of RpoE activity)
MRKTALCLIVLPVLVFYSSAKAEAQPNDPAPSAQGSNGVVQLPPFVVEAASAPARLRIDFRHHMLWARLRSLTFTDVPAVWAKAGIKAGDRVVKIDGKHLDGMRLFKDFFPFFMSKMDPLMQKKVTEVPFLFEIQADDSKSLRQIKVILQSSSNLTVYSYGL